MIKTLEERRKPIMNPIHTAETKSRAGHNAGLDDGVLLAGEGLPEKSGLFQECGPDLDEEEAEQAGGDVQRRYDTRGEIELHHDEAKEHP